MKPQEGREGVCLGVKVRNHSYIFILKIHCLLHHKMTLSVHVFDGHITIISWLHKIIWSAPLCPPSSLCNVINEWPLIHWGITEGIGGSKYHPKWFYIIHEWALTVCSFIDLVFLQFYLNWESLTLTAS